MKTQKILLLIILLLVMAGCQPSTLPGFTATPVKTLTPEPPTPTQTVMFSITPEEASYFFLTPTLTSTYQVIEMPKATAEPHSIKISYFTQWRTLLSHLYNACIGENFKYSAPWFYQHQTFSLVKTEAIFDIEEISYNRKTENASHSRLVFIACEGDRCELDLFIKDLNSGITRVLKHSDWGYQRSITGLKWINDDTLAFALHAPGTGVSNMYVLDVVTWGTLFDGWVLPAFVCKDETPGLTLTPSKP